MVATLDKKRVTAASNYTYDLALNKVTSALLLETPISWLERAVLRVNATTRRSSVNYKIDFEHNLLGRNQLTIEASTGPELRLRLILEAEKTDWKRAEFEILTNERMLCSLRSSMHNSRLILLIREEMIFYENCYIVHTNYKDIILKFCVLCRTWKNANSGDIFRDQQWLLAQNNARVHSKSAVG